MGAPHLFLTGEPQVTLPLLRRHPTWAPVLSALYFDFVDRRLHRRRSASDDFRACLYFADVRDKDIERHNLQTLLASGLPCWPDPARLLAVSHRPDVLARCVDEGLVSHPVIRSFPTREPLLPFPHVLKEGDLHRGEGKHLIRSADDIPGWEGEATAEPFFVGDSVRVLLIEDDVFGARLDHPTSWIKNTTGGTVSPWQPPGEVVAHARRVARLVDLAIVGVDYVLTPEGPRLLEVNPFPRVGLSVESTAAARRVLAHHMAQLERLARG